MGKALRIASWNLENFFDRYNDPYRNDQSSRATTPQRQARMAAVLRELDPDLVAVQEVENRFLLERFVHKHLPDSGYQVVLIEGNDDRGIDVGLLSRLPVRSSTSYRHRRFRAANGREYNFRRDLLRVEISAPMRFDVFVAHLKSQRGDHGAELIRTAEAEEIARIVREEAAEHASYRAVLLGDLNEKPGGNTLRTLTEAGLIDTMAHTRKATFHQRPHRGRLDYALVTHALRDHVHSARIVDHLPGHDLKKCSDHFPLLLEVV